MAASAIRDLNAACISAGTEAWRATDPPTRTASPTRRRVRTHRVDQRSSRLDPLRCLDRPRRRRVTARAERALRLPPRRAVLHRGGRAPCMRLRRPATADTVRREAHRAFRVRPSRAPALPGALDRGDRLVRRGVRGSLRRRIVRTRACCSSCRGGADLPRRRASVSHDDVRRLDVDRARLPRRPDRPDRGPALVVALRRRGRHRPAEQVDRPLPRWRARSRPRSD